MKKTLVALLSILLLAEFTFPQRKSRHKTRKASEKKALSIDSRDVAKPLPEWQIINGTSADTAVYFSPRTLVNSGSNVRSWTKTVPLIEKAKERIVEPIIKMLIDAGANENGSPTAKRG